MRIAARGTRLAFIARLVVGADSDGVAGGKAERALVGDARSRGTLRLAPVVVVLTLFCGCGRTSPQFIERPPLKGHEREVTSVTFVPGGVSLASRAADGIKVWDLATGKPTFDYVTPNSGNFGTVACSPSEMRLATEEPGKGAIDWDLTNRSESVHFAFPPEPPAETKVELNRSWGLAYSLDGSYLVGAGIHQPDRGFLTIWETATGKATELPALPRPITTVAVSPDGQTIASGSMDGKIVLWDRRTGQERLTINAIRSYLAPVIFSPDGRFVVSANEARWVTFWDVATGRNAGTFKGHIKAILSLAFHPDGKTLVSGDSGGTVFVWDVPSRKTLTRLESGDRGKVWSLAFSPDGKILAAGSEDKFVHLWDLLEPGTTGK